MKTFNQLIAEVRNNTSLTTTRRITKKERKDNAPPGHHWNPLFKRYVPNYKDVSIKITDEAKDSFTDEFTGLSESSMHHIRDLPVGSVIHPYSGIGYSTIHYGQPHTVVRKTQTKTIIKNQHSGEEFSVSHATGAVKDNQGKEQKYSYRGFTTPAEKEEYDDRRNTQREKDMAHDAIASKLAGLKNGFGNTVGSLSDDEHTEILQHLEKLRK